MTEIRSVFWCFLIATVLQSYTRGYQNLGYQNDASAPSSQVKPYSNASDAHYGPWSAWSRCSHTCGSGISMRSRNCNRKSSSQRGEDAVCLGESTDHKICRQKECPPGSPDSRESQCSRYDNTRIIDGKRADSWLPTNGGTNPCELRCLAMGHVASFGKVEDGTPCGRGVCLDGRCLLVGCDDRLGSGVETDMCGVCGGRNATCVHYKDIFYGQLSISSSQERRGDYQEVATIPVGSRNLEIRQRIGENILAVRDQNTAILYHGEYRLSPNNKSIAGTVLTYLKDDTNNNEILRSNGPIVMKLHVLIYLRERNSGVYYQYWIPLEQTYPSRHLATRPVAGTSTPADRTTPHYQPSRGPYLTTKPTSAPYARPRYETARLITAPNNRATPSIRLAGPSTIATPNYGPKRQGLFYAQFQNIHSKPLVSFQEKNVQHFTASNEVQSLAPPMPVFIPRFHVNYKTRKPVFDYYEKFRNVSFHQSESIPKAQDMLPQQTQRDSGIANGVEKRRNSRFSEEDQEKNKKATKYTNFTHFENPSPKWRYSFNGKTRDANGWSTTPVSIAVLPLPETRNYTKTRRGKRRGLKQQSRIRPPSDGSCRPCQRIRDQTKHFCHSDFVIRAIVMGYEFLHGETRYELEILQTFKNTFALLTREYIWSPDTCRCPKLRIGKEYVLMGRSDDNYRRNESRLIVDRNSFVRNYNDKFTKRLLKLKKDQARKCLAKIS